MTPAASHPPGLACVPRLAGIAERSSNFQTEGSDFAHMTGRTCQTRTEAGNKHILAPACGTAVPRHRLEFPSRFTCEILFTSLEIIDSWVSREECVFGKARQRRVGRPPIKPG